MRMESLFAGAKDVGGVRLITAKLDGTDADSLRLMCDRVREHAPDLVAVLAGIQGGKANIAVACAPEALKKGAHAGRIVKEVAMLAGGGGGGRPDSAMAGTKQPEKLDEALSAAEKIVANMIK